MIMNHAKHIYDGLLFTHGADQFSMVIMLKTNNLFHIVLFTCYFQSCISNCLRKEPTVLWIIGVFHLTVHVASLNPLTFEDNLYLGHTEVCVSVGCSVGRLSGLFVVWETVMFLVMLFVFWVPMCLKWSESTRKLHNYLSLLGLCRHVFKKTSF